MDTLNRRTRWATVCERIVAAQKFFLLGVMLKTNKASDRIDRRRFLQLTAAAVGTPVIWASESDETKPGTQGETAIRNHRETMTYRKLGRTEMVASRLARRFACSTAPSKRGSTSTTSEQTSITRAASRAWRRS